MTAQAPRQKRDRDDPAEILARLPESCHAHFRAEYAVAVEQARRPEQYRMLHQLLRLWRLRAVAYGDPGYADRSLAPRTRVLTLMCRLSSWLVAGQVGDVPGCLQWRRRCAVSRPSRDRPGPRCCPRG
ncbi:DUF6247 family protein [Microlunatus endophyticus]|uniref:DUF6247 family protein n=1 Tax=Microlunatus endophyticus TaxID=1716077 RepID=UPI0035713998